MRGRRRRKDNKAKMPVHYEYERRKKHSNGESELTSLNGINSVNDETC